MAIAYGARAGSNKGATQVSSFVITTTADIPAGSLIVVSVGCGNVGDLSNLTSVTDSAGNVYQSAAFTVDGGQNTLAAVWYSVTGNALLTGGTVTVTLHASLLASGEFWTGSVDYLTGTATTTPTDGTNSHNSQTAATWDTNSITTTNAADLVWAFFCTNQGGAAAITNAQSTPTSGWTTLAQVAPSAPNVAGAGYQVFAATGTYKGGGTAQAFNNGTSAVLVAFKAAAGGGPTNVSVSDSGAGADALASLTVSVPLTDAGSGADSLAALSVNTTLTEAGSGADALGSLSVSASIADAGAAGAESVVITAQLAPVTDAGSGAESVTVAQIVPVAVADAGTGVDALAALSIGLSLVDAGAGADAAAFLSPMTFTLTDAGAGLDSLIVAGASQMGLATGGDRALAGVTATVAALSSVGAANQAAALAAGTDR